MSVSGLKLVFKKMHEDEKFLNDILSDAETALKEFDLSNKEILLFKNASSDKLLAFKDNFDKRSSKDGSGGGDDDWWVESVTD